MPHKPKGKGKPGKLGKKIPRTPGRAARKPKGKGVNPARKTSARTGTRAARGRPAKRTSARKPGGRAPVARKRRATRTARTIRDAFTIPGGTPREQQSGVAGVRGKKRKKKSARKS